MAIGNIPPDPKDQAEVNKLYAEYIDLLQRAEGISYKDAQIRADLAKSQGKLNLGLAQAKALMQDMVYQSDYLFRSFQETVAELRNQNNLLKIGKSLFSELTATAQKLTNFQSGYTDLTEKNFKKLEGTLGIQRKENDRIVADLKKSESIREKEIKHLEDQIENGQTLSRIQKKRYDELLKERDLYNAALDAQKNGIPILEKELSLTKAIGKARQDIGGLAGAAAATLSKFGGDLAQYLDISEASEAVAEFNKGVIDDALKTKQVLDDLRNIEEQRIQLEQDIADKIEESNVYRSKAIELTKQIAEIDDLIINKGNIVNFNGNQTVEGLLTRKNIIQSILKGSAIDVTEQGRINSKLDEQLSLQERVEEIRSRQVKITEELADVEGALANQQNLSQGEINELQTRRNRLHAEESVLRSEAGRKSARIADLETEINNITADGNDLLNDANNRIQTKTTLTNDLTQAQQKQAASQQEAQQKQANLSHEQNKLEQKAYDIKKKAVQDASTGLTGFINKFKSLGVLVENLNFTKVFTDPIVLITTLISLGLKANSQMVELGKSLGISADQAGDLREEAAKYARETNDTFVNTDRLLKAQAELSKELGIAVKFSNEELATFSKLTELTGLTAQEAGKLAAASAAANIPTEDYADSIREAAFYAQQSTGTHFESKEILQDVSKLSAGILVKFKNNPKALGEAVVQAKKLGLTLEQIDKVGESLLNWESSIENELKAELLTGKELNMERARAAALSGDQLTLTQEIADQVGSLEDYQNMNVIAQRSLAEAFGLSRDEMSEMLMKQQAINKYGAIAKDLNKEQLEALEASGLSAAEFVQKQEQQRTAQAKFQDAIVKLQTILGNLVDGPVGQLLDAFADLSGAVVGIFKIFSPILTVVSSIAKIIIGAISGPIKFIADSVTVVTDGISAAINFVLSGFTAVKNAVSPFFSAIGSLLSPIISFFSPIASFVGSIGKGLAQWVIGLTAIGVISGFVFSKLIGGFKGIFDSIGGIGKGITEAFSSDGVSKFFDKVFGGFTKTESLVETVTDKAQETVTESATDSLTEKATDKGKELIEEKVEGKVDDAIMGEAEEVTDSADKLKGDDGTNLKKKLQNIAKGLKSFANKDVLLGALNLIPTAIGLTAMIPGAIGAKLISIVDGEKLEKALKGIAKGLKYFGDKNLFAGIGNLILASVGLTAMIPGAIGAKLISIVDGEKFEKAMKGIAKGITHFGSKNLFAGTGNLILTAVGLTAMIPGAIGAKLISLVDGEKFEKSMKGIAKGIEAFGKGKILLGSTLMLPAALGLTAMIPGAIGAKIISSVDGKAFTKSMSGIAAGIEAFGKGKILVGSLLMLPAALGLIAMIPGIIGANLIQKSGIGPKFKTSLENIASGIEAFGKGKIIVGSLLMPVASVGLIAILPGALAAKGIEKIDIKEKFKTSLVNIATGIEAFGKGKVLGGSLLMVVASAGLIGMLPGALAAKGIEMIDIKKKFSTSMGNIAEGISNFGKEVSMGAIGKLALSSLALIALSLAVPGLLLLQFVNGSLIKKALTGIGEGIAALGKALSKPQVILGVAVFTLAMMGLGKALQMAAPAIEALAPVIESVGNVISKIFGGIATVITAASVGIATIFSSLENVDVSKLLAIGPALIGIGLGLASLGAGSVMEAIGSFLGGGPAEKLEQLAASGEGLQVTATALQNIATALTGVSSALASIDVTKLEALDKFASNRASEATVGGIVDVITSPFKAIGRMIGGEENQETPPSPEGITPTETINTTSTKTETITTGGIDLTPMINAINEVKAAVTNLQNRPVKLYMDSREVTTRQLQANNSI